MVGYPIYTVPHPQAEAALDQVRIMQNFDYFMGVRLERLAAFRIWLHQHFNVAAPLDEPGLHAVNAWVERYGGGLVADIGAMRSAFFNNSPAWEGPFAGCNVMLDLAIFFGEYLIAQRPRLKWICPLDCPKGLEPEDVPDFGRPHIGGFVHPWRVNVCQMGRGDMLTARKRSEIGHDLMSTQRNVVIKKCEQVLKMADAPDDGKPYIF